MVNLSSVGLDRLLVLHAVLEERSVTRAAARLHVTPPAVSNALAVLRRTFDDPLVVRSGRGLVLTPRAEVLAPRLAEAIAAMERAVGERPFDPATTSRAFSLACSDAEQIAGVPLVAEALARRMPLATLRVVSVDQLASSDGLAGDVDVAIAPAAETPAGIRWAPLYTEEVVLVVRRDHPCLAGPVRRELFTELRHVDILLALGRGGIGHRQAEAFFASMGLRRDVAVSVPGFAAAAAVVARTDLVTGMPKRLAELFVGALPLAILPLPLPPMRFRMRLHWHERTDADPGARAFRELVVDALGDGERATAR